MELFLMFICCTLGAVVGYEVVKFLRVLWFFHRLGKAKKALDEAISELDKALADQNEDELVEGTIEKAFSDLGTFGKPVQKTLEGKEEERWIKTKK